MNTAKAPSKSKPQLDESEEEDCPLSPLDDESDGEWHDRDFVAIDEPTGVVTLDEPSSDRQPEKWLTRRRRNTGNPETTMRRKRHRALTS